MNDVRENILKAQPKCLAGLLGMDSGNGRLWQTHELAAIFRHQLAAPVEMDLAKGAAGNAHASVTGCTDIQTFDELFHSPTPPLELLKSVKEFAKANRDHPSSVLPNEIAAVLYYASVLIARWRCEAVITTLNDKELRSGINWAIAEPWVDERTKSLFRESSRALDPARQVGSP